MNDSRDYYIVLGAGENQIPLISAAREEGLAVIGVDKDINAPGLELCDIRVEESIYNYRKIDYKLNMGLTGGNVVGGYSGSFGAALLSWAYIAERFLLPAPSRTLMEVMTDKYEVRQRLKKTEFSSFKQPRVLIFEQSVLREDLEDLGFPMIIKTRGGFGKHNVYMIEKYSEIRQFLTRRHLNQIQVKPEELIIEEFIDGEEIIVIGLIHDFDYTLVSVTDKRHSPQPPFVDLEHSWPSSVHASHNEIQKLHQKIVETLQIPVGPLVSEWKLKNGQYYLIELSPQIPGEMLGNFLIPEVIGYNFHRNLVRVTTGKPPEQPGKPKKQSGSVRYFDRKPNPDDWEELARKAVFARILNENGPREMSSNADRYGVMGFKE